MRSLRSPRAFTLVEVLAAVAVLSILMLAIGASYTGVTAAWRTGTSLSEQASSGRAALQFVANELSTAVCDSGVGLKLEPGHKTILGRASSSLHAALGSLKAETRSGNTYRAVSQAWYYVDENETRSMGAGAMDFKTFSFKKAVVENSGAATYKIYKKTVPTDPLPEPAWWSAMTPNGVGLVFNIRRFFAQVGVIELATGRLVLLDKYDSSTDSKPPSPRYSFPLFIDLYLETLSDQQAQEIALRTASGPELADKYAQKFTTRVHLRNGARAVQDMVP